LRNLRIHLALLLLLCPINAVNAWTITGNDDQDFWQRLGQSDRSLDEQLRARKLREEELQRIDEDERDQRDRLKRRDRPLFQTSDNYQTKLGDADDEKYTDSDSIAGFKRNQDKTLPDDLKSETSANRQDSYSTDLSKDRKGDHSTVDEEHKLAEKLEWRKLTEVRDQFDDWVPSKPDPSSNGGFTIYPDNGSPVPYKLNGHVDIQRKLPWQAEN
jgi:hypothetical protein